jgi:hypothetical protein
VAGTVLLHALHVYEIVTQPSWTATGGVQFARDVFKSLTGYSIKSDDMLATSYAVDYDTKMLLVQAHLPSSQYLLAIIAGLGLILGGQTLSADSAPLNALATALAQDPGDVIQLDERRLLRKRGIPLKEVARVKRTSAPPHTLS